MMYNKYKKESSKMKKLLSLLTAAVLCTSSISSMTAFTIKTKQNVKLKNNIQNNILKDVNTNQEKANAIMTKLANKSIIVPNYGSYEDMFNHAYDHIDFIQWALNEIVPQTETPYKFYWANSDGNKLLSENNPQKIFIGVEVNGVKCAMGYEANINVSLSNKSVDDILFNMQQKIENSWLSLTEKNNMTIASDYSSEILQYVHQNVQLKNIQYNVKLVDGGNVVLNGKFQEVHVALNIDGWKDNWVSLNVRFGKVPSTSIKPALPMPHKEAILPAQAILKQWNATGAQAKAAFHIDRPTLWYDSSTDLDYYYASYYIYVNWYNVHWACQTKGNFFANIFKHFINYSGRSITQALKPAAWANNQNPVNNNIYPTYNGEVAKVSPFDDAALNSQGPTSYVGAITSNMWWTWSNITNTFYDAISSKLKNEHNYRSVDDVKNQIYYDAAHAPKGSHGIEFQISFALNSKRHFSQEDSLIWLGDGNCSPQDNTDLPNIW